MLVLATVLAALAVSIAGLLRYSLVNSPPVASMITNYRGKTVPAVGGIVIAGTFLVTEAIFAIVSLLRPGAPSVPSAVSATAIAGTFFSDDHIGILLVVLGFFMLGLLDDLSGTHAGRARGFGGHFRQLRRGVVTTGAIKAGGGLIIGLVAGALWELSLLPALVDGVLIALFANLVNLLDLRPGRATKFFMIAWLPVAISAWASPFFAVSAGVFASAGAWLVADLKEEGTLGDSGANLLGAVVGAGYALHLDLMPKVALMAILLLLNLASERWSFTKAIESFAPLRWIDGLGRKALGAEGRE